MVFTRKMLLSSAQASSETEKESDWAELKSERKARAIAKDRKMSQSALRRRIREKIAEKGFRRARVLGLGKEQHFSEVAPQKLNCPICLEFLLEPRLTPCGHAFCLACIEESLRHKSACSLCREAVTLEEPLPSRFLAALARAAAQRLSRQEAEDYAKRREAFELREAQRQLQAEIQLGDMVDFYMERGWHEGRVVEIREDSSGKLLKIRSSQNESRTRELAAGSRLLARYRSFTKEPAFTRRNSIFMFEFEDELFNSISNSVFFFLESPVRHIEFLEMEAN